MNRAVLDPGVLVAALISPKGPPAGLVLAWIEGRFDLIVSPQLLSEMERVLSREKFRSYATLAEAEEYIAALRNLATVVPDPRAEPGLTPDPKDDYLVALARVTEADCLVSGDAHLTSLPNPHPPVLTPRAFLNAIASAP